MRLTFLGAAQTVTGSKYLVEHDGHRVMVDCGLFQGLRELRLLNWKPLPVDAASIESVVLTHAHLDHTGYLPRLVAQGFAGRAFCTPGTKDLCQVILPDAGRLQEEDAHQANKHGYSRHHPALPLFTEGDAYAALATLQPLGYGVPVEVAPGIEIEFLEAGHLLGSAFARMRVGGAEGRLVLFGGDLGRYDRPVLLDPVPVDTADVLLLESTYGNRVHSPDDDGEHLAEVIRSTVKLGGKLLVPSFAIGRVEEVLYWIKKLESEGRIPVLPVFVDSPMALEALKYYTARAHELDPELRAAGRDVCTFCTQRFHPVQSADQSKALVRSRVPSIIISASGMATGGRVLHHLKALLPDRRNTVLFVGYQAAGTRGRSLVDGMHEVKIHGRMIPVSARIDKIDSMSAHADREEILRWLGGFSHVPGVTYLVHGEPEPIAALESTIDETLGWTTHAPRLGETVDLEMAGVAR